jgi:membrane protein DedA with SNARE-associated domain
LSWFSPEALQYLVATYGYIAVALAIGIESMGIPLPGETMLVLAAIYAGGNPDHLNIYLVAAAAATGAIIGDNAGYYLGHRYGYPLARRFGRHFGLTEGRLKLGQYLFMRYGAQVVFWGRFVALLRILAAFLAGVNQMHWPKFLLANAAGGILWASVFAFGGYLLGQLVFQVQGMLGPIIFIFAATGFLVVGYLLRRYEDRLQEEAERVIPGPLR